MEMYRALRHSLGPLSTPMFLAVCYSSCNPPPPLEHRFFVFRATTDSHSLNQNFRLKANYWSDLSHLSQHGKCHLLSLEDRKIPNFKISIFGLRWVFCFLSHARTHLLSSPTDPDSETKTRQEYSALPTCQTRVLIRTRCDAVWICLSLMVIRQINQWTSSGL